MRDGGSGDGVGVGVADDVTVGVAVGGMFWDVEVVCLLSKTTTVPESPMIITSSTIIAAIQNTFLWGLSGGL